MYLNLSTYKTILWGSVNTGINNPSNAAIYEEAYQQIENNSVFIDLKGFAGDLKEEEEQAYLRIIKVSHTKSIYLTENTNVDKYGN